MITCTCHKVYMVNMYNSQIKATSDILKLSLPPIPAKLRNLFTKHVVIYNKSQFIENIEILAQGSVLGSLLFLIYINDIIYASRLLKEILFADDTRLTSTLTAFYVYKPKTKNDIAILSNRIYTELTKITDRLKIKKSSLNKDKTKYMIFHTPWRNMEIYETLSIKMNNLPIKRVKSFNFLGIIVNETLTWTDHIAHLSQKNHQ